MPVKRKPKNEDEKKIFSILNKIDDISHNYGIYPFIVGGFCRNEFLRIEHSLESDIDMMAQNYDGLILAGLISSELNIPIEFSHKSGTAKLHIDGIKIDFKANLKNFNFLPYMREMNLPQNNLSFDIISRDFTINTLAIGLKSWHMYDVLGVAKEDLKNNMLRTPVDPDFTIKESPLVFLRALKFALRDGYEISPELDKAMMLNKEAIYKLPEEETKESLIEYYNFDKSEAKKLYERYGLEGFLS